MACCHSDLSERTSASAGVKIRSKIKIGVRIITIIKSLIILPNCHRNIILNHYHHHVLPLAWTSLTLSRHFSLSFIASAGLQGYIPYPHIAAVCMFELVVMLLLGHMRGSIGVHHLWARPCFSSTYIILKNTTTYNLNRIKDSSSLLVPCNLV